MGSEKASLNNIEPSEIQNMTILYIASHDGRRRFAAIKNGTKKLSSMKAADST
jgi:hypothetical protein